MATNYQTASKNEVFLLPMKSLHLVKKKKLKDFPNVYKILWSKNLFAYTGIDYKRNESYIKIAIEDIAPENMDVITSLEQPYLKKIEKNDFLIIRVRGVGKGPQRRLTELAHLFLLQDIPEHRLYISREEVLKKCGFGNSPHNPNCIPFETFKKRKRNTPDLEPEKSNKSQETRQSSEYEISLAMAAKGFILDENKGLYYRSSDLYARHLAYLQENVKRKARKTSPILSQEKK